MEVLTEQTNFRSYYNKVLPGSAFEYLSREEEAALISKAQAGDKKALERLLMANYGYIIKQAKYRQHTGTTIEDLIAEGMVGFIKAVNKFDLEKGYRLITVAQYQLKGEFKAEAEKNVLIKGDEDKNITSLNVKVSANSDSCELGDLIAIDDENTPDSVFERKMFRTYLRKSVSLLPERERRVAELAFGFVKPKTVRTRVNAFGMVEEKRVTLESIGEELGYRKQRVQQIFADVKVHLHDENGAGKYVAGYLAA